MVMLSEADAKWGRKAQRLSIGRCPGDDADVSNDDDENKPVWRTWAVGGLFRGARCRNVQSRTPVLEISHRGCLDSPKATLFKDGQHTQKEVRKSRRRRRIRRRISPFGQLGLWVETNSHQPRMC